MFRTRARITNALPRSCFAMRRINFEWGNCSFLLTYSSYSSFHVSFLTGRRISYVASGELRRSVRLRNKEQAEEEELGRKEAIEALVTGGTPAAARCEDPDESESGIVRKNVLFFDKTFSNNVWYLERMK